MTEVWKDIKGFEGKYAVSNLGNVKRLECYKRCGVSGKTLLEEKPMRFYKNHNGYYRVCLCKDGKRYFRFVHLLVVEAFLPKADGKTQVNHIAGNKENNSVANLEWVTSKENHIHASETGLKKSMKVAIVETGEVFNSIGLCAKHINGCKAVVAKRLSDHSDMPYKGYHFRYYGERSE
jgi:hypothetical protein